MRLDGTKIVVTGTFADHASEELIATLKERGAIIADGIAPDIEVVFAGEDAGIEVDEARELGIRVADAEVLEAALSADSADEKPLPPVDELPAETAGPPEPPPSDDWQPVVDDQGPPPDVTGDAPHDEPGGDEDGPREFGKGARVKIVGGLEGVGEVGNIFWWGESKFGEGMRAGVSGDDDETYWVDEEHLGWPDDEVPDEVIEAAEAASVFGKGDRVEVTSGKDSGAVGTIFWWGESKWGDGMRAGLKTDDDETVWADAEELKAVDDEDDDIPF